MRRDQSIVAVLFFLVVINPLNVLRAQPGVSDLLTPILKHVDGFNAWVSFPNYKSSIGKDSIDSPTQAGHQRYAFSLKYNALNIVPMVDAHGGKPDGEIGLKTTTLECDTTFSGGGVVQSIKVKSVKSPSQSRLFDTTYAGNISVNFGYSYTTPVKITTNPDSGKPLNGLVTTFPYSGFFVAGITTFHPFNENILRRLNLLYQPDSIGDKNHPGFWQAIASNPLFRRISISCGIQATFYSLTNVNGRYTTADSSNKLTYTDTNATLPVQFSTGLIVSPEFFAGVAIDLGGVYLFGDWSRQLTEFSGLTFSPLNSTDQKKFSNIFSKLPSVFNLYANHWKLGFSITVPNLVSAS